MDGINISNYSQSNNIYRGIQNNDINEQDKHIADDQHLLTDSSLKSKDVNVLKEELKGKFNNKSEKQISAAAYLLSNQVSPEIIMQQLESIYREQSLSSKKMAADLSVEVSKTRIDVYNAQKEANKKEIDAEVKKANISLGVGLGSSGAGVLLEGLSNTNIGNKMGADGKIITDEKGVVQRNFKGKILDFGGSLVQNVGKTADGIGALATSNDMRFAKQERTQADMQKSMGDDFSKKTEQMEQNAQELRKKAIETIQAAANIHAQAQQSLRVKI